MTQKNTEVSWDRDHKSGQARGSGRTEEGVRKSFPKEVTLNSVTEEQEFAGLGW